MKKLKNRIEELIYYKLFPCNTFKKTLKWIKKIFDICNETTLELDKKLFSLLLEVSEKNEIIE